MEAPVVIDGSSCLRCVASRRIPPKSARRKSRADRSVAANPALSPKALTITETADGSQIAAGNQIILTVLDADAQLEQVRRPLLARIYVKRISEAIEAYRRDRTSEYLLRSAGHVLVATLASGAFLWVGRRAVRRIDRGTRWSGQGTAHRAGSPLHADGQCLSSVGCVAGVRKFIWSMATVIAVVFYLDYVLQLFPWTRLVRFASVVLAD